MNDFFIFDTVCVVSGFSPKNSSFNMLYHVFSHFFNVWKKCGVRWSRTPQMSALCGVLDRTLKSSVRVFTNGHACLYWCVNTKYRQNSECSLMPGLCTFQFTSVIYSMQKRLLQVESILQPAEVYYSQYWSVVVANCCQYRGTYY